MGKLTLNMYRKVPGGVVSRMETLGAGLMNCGGRVMMARTLITTLHWPVL